MKNRQIQANLKSLSLELKNDPPGLQLTNGVEREVTLLDLKFRSNL